MIAGLGLAIVVAPASTQFYQGTMTGTTTHAVTMINMRLTFNGDAISGGIGIGSVVGGAQIVGQLQPTIPVQGIRSGTTCTLRIVGNGAGLVMTGPCTATSFSGTYYVGAQSGRFSVSGSGSTATAPTSVASGPASRPGITYPSPSTSYPPAAMPASPSLPSTASTVPATSARAATQYCGTDHNTSYNISWSLEVTIDPGPAFTGNISSGNLVSGQTASENRRIGDGSFTGTRSGNSCNGTTQAGEVFTGTCTPTAFNATYTALGQHGTLSATTKACGTNRITLAPVVAAPGPTVSRAVIPTPVYASQPVSKPATTVSTAPAPAPATQPVSKVTPATPKPTAVAAPVAVTLPAPGGAKYCGTDTNTTYNVSWNLVVTIDPGAVFTGSIISGVLVSGSAATRVGDGAFTGTRNGTACQGTTQAGEAFTGTCTPTTFNATYTAMGQRGTLKATTQACGGQNSPPR